MGHYARVLCCEIEIGKDVLKWGDDVEWNRIIRLVLCTDCKSVFDTVHKSQQSVGDRSVTLGVAGLRQIVTTDTSDPVKATLLWIPTRYQIADCLMKHGKGAVCRVFLRNGEVHFRGISAKQLRFEQKSKSRVSVNS